MPLNYVPPNLPRYTQIPFPAYRYLPFQAGMPHPRNDPAGHSYAAEEICLPSFASADWRDCQPYLYGVDLFNHGYWWEAHEAWEAVWQAAGTRSETGLFLQGLIQVAGAQLKRFIGEMRGAELLTETGAMRLGAVRGVFRGIEVAPFVAEVERCLRENRGEYPRIALHCA